MGLSDSSLLELERLVEVALDQRSADGLDVLGFGETSIAIAWPPPEPEFVVKRLVAVKTLAGVEHARETIDRYIRQITPHAAVAPTEIRSIRNDIGWHVPYLVQPLYPREALVEVILAEATPWLRERSGSPDAPDVVYLDPMFSEAGKAQVKKEMQACRVLAGAPHDAAELLAAARAAARDRVVVKRHPHHKPLADDVSFEVGGDRVRFDVYLAS